MFGRNRFGPVDYKGFIDGEGFDGGDGQVGCVGDGECSLMCSVHFFKANKLGCVCFVF